MKRRIDKKQHPQTDYKRRMFDYRLLLSQLGIVRASNFKEAPNIPWKNPLDKPA